MSHSTAAGYLSREKKATHNDKRQSFPAVSIPASLRDGAWEHARSHTRPAPPSHATLADKTPSSTDTE